MSLTDYQAKYLAQEKGPSLFEAQDTIDRQREELTGKIEGKLRQSSTLETFFTPQWKLVFGFTRCLSPTKALIKLTLRVKK